MSYAYAWEIQNRNGSWALCWWAEPTRKQLVARSKPSPEARPVRVKLVRAPRKRKEPKP